MADTSRKRSRESKLVSPRQCNLDSDDEDRYLELVLAARPRTNEPAVASSSSDEYLSPPTTPTLVPQQGRHQPTTSLAPAGQPASSRAPAPGGDVRRMKWTRKINENVMRAYYGSTAGGTNRTAYRERMLSMFHDLEPDINVSAQRLSDQVRVIQRHHRLDDDTLDYLRSEVQELLGINTFSRKSSSTVDIKDEPTTSSCPITQINATESFTENPPMVHVSEPPMQINVKVEVERCDETNKPCTQKTTEQKIYVDDIAFWKKYRIKKFYLCNNMIVNTADKIMQHSTDIADKILDVAVRNTTGHIDKGALQHKTLQPIGIQNALDQWKDWQTKHFLRDEPLFYKCYVCREAWWYLEDFTQHIQKHVSLNISVENQSLHEINIITYAGTFAFKEDIFASGKCGRCGQDYYNHSVGSKEKIYSCHGCSKEFHTCLSLGFHVSNCPTLGLPKTRITCQICRLEIPTINNHDHLVTVHSVRSDIPIITRQCQYNTCDDCNERYINTNQHVCADITYTRCKYCFRGFPTKYLADLHLEGYNRPYNCPICNEKLDWECMKYEHMLTHSDKYAIVFKCILCVKFIAFLSTTGFLKHLKTTHKSKDFTKSGYYTQIMIPKTCLHLYSDWFAKEHTVEVNNKEIVEVNKESTEEVKQDVQINTGDGHENVQDKTEVDSEMKEIVEDIPQIQIKNEPVEPAEPAETEKISGLKIKAEPLYGEEQIETPEYNSHEVVKEELNLDDIDVYEDDIIKLDMNTQRFEIKEEKDDSQDAELNEYRNQTDSKDDEAKGSKKLYKCKKCGFEAIHSIHKIHVNSDCYKIFIEVKKFPCTQCRGSFKTLGKYLTHLTLHGYEAHTCPECLIEFKTHSTLISHVTSHMKLCFINAFNGEGPHNKAEYQCSKCSIMVEPKLFFVHWESHLSLGSMQSAKSLADINDFSTPAIAELLNRLHKKTKQCCYCLRFFTKVNQCKRHHIEHLLTDAYDHKDQYKELRCQICAEGFSTPEKYRRHMRDHAGLPVYRCDMCNRSFSDSSSFTKHKKMHNFQVLVCDLCKKKFRSKVGLTKHLEMHMNSKPTVCEICLKTFHFETAYQKHIKYCHSKVGVGYACVKCNVRFATSKHKWRHMWEVHKERKIDADCPVCLKSFRLLSEVRAHMKNEHCTKISVGKLRSELQ